MKWCLVLVLFLVIDFAAANVYINNTTYAAVPQYYGRQPFLTFGNISGMLVDALTPAKLIYGNIMLCMTALAPTEPKLLDCIKHRPAGVIAVAQQRGRRVEYLGRSMYQVHISFMSIPEELRQTPIVEVDLPEYLQIAREVGEQVTIDGSTYNVWITIAEGGWGVFYQVTTSVSALLIAAYCAYKIYLIYKYESLQPNLKLAVLVIIFVATAMRGIYCAIDPANLRRIINGPDNFFITNIILALLIASTTMLALYWYETISGLGGLRVTAFLTHPITRIAMHLSNVVWGVFIIIVRILDGHAEELTMSIGYSKLTITTILVVMIGICAILYTYTGAHLLLILLKSKRAAGGGSLYKKMRLIYVGVSAASLWSIFAATIVVLTPAWDIPWVSTVLQWWCYVAHSIIQALQAVSFRVGHDAGSSGSSKKPSQGTMPTEYSRTAGAVDTTTEPPTPRRDRSRSSRRHKDIV